MKYRAKLIDPGNATQERPIEIHSNSFQDIKEWARKKEEWKEPAAYCPMLTRRKLR